VCVHVGACAGVSAWGGLGWNAQLSTPLCQRAFLRLTLRSNEFTHNLNLLVWSLPLPHADSKVATSLLAAITYNFSLPSSHGLLFLSLFRPGDDPVCACARVHVNYKSFNKPGKSRSARGLVFVRVTMYFTSLSHKYRRCPGNVGRPCAASKPSSTHENFGGRLAATSSYAQSPDKLQRGPQTAHFSIHHIDTTVLELELDTPVNNTFTNKIRGRKLNLHTSPHMSHTPSFQLNPANEYCEIISSSKIFKIK